VVVNKHKTCTVFLKTESDDGRITEHNLNNLNHDHELLIIEVMKT
jgi:hypothetical protein